MKKIYLAATLALTSAAVMAQSGQKIDAANKVNTSKFADRATTIGSIRAGGGLSCPFAEGFDSGFPGTWTNVATNANQNWVYSATGGNPDGHMDIQYDDALGQQDESLVTSAIDLSAIPTPGLYFDWFMSYYWGVSPNDNYDLIVSISTDGGTNYTQLWSEASEPEFASYEWFTKVLDLSAYASETSAIFKFTYYGMDGAQAKFDNINVCTQPANDLRLDVVFTGDVINDYLYSKIPVSQAVEVVAGAVASNFGATAQTNLSYDWSLTLDGTEVASGTASGAASLAAGGVDTVWVSTGYTPSAVGVLEIAFEVSADETENVPADNTLSAAVEYTDFVWAHDYDSEDYFGLGYAASDPDGSGGFEMGARYFCQIDGDQVYALNFALSSSTNSQSVTVNVYENDPAGGAVSTSVYDIQPGDLSSGSVNFITVVLDEAVEMIAGNVYSATVAIEAGEDGYILGNSIDDNDGGQSLYLGNDDSWYNWIGLTTSMRLNLNPDIASVGGLTDLSGVYFYPNPANSIVNIGFVSLEGKDVTASIVSLDGKLVSSKRIATVAGQSSMITLGVEGLASGAYVLRVESETSSLVQKLVME